MDRIRLLFVILAFALIVNAKSTTTPDINTAKGILTLHLQGIYPTMSLKKPVNGSATIVGNTTNVNLTMRFATYCTTPNNDNGYCIEVENCHHFAGKTINAKHPAYDFYVASNCTPAMATSVKVCCGAHENFESQLPKKQTVPEENIASSNPLPQDCGLQPTMTFNRRIIGGLNAEVGEFPWMARIVHRNYYGRRSYGCSAFLIHPKFLLTAAHCLSESLLKLLGPVFQVNLGDHNTSAEIDCRQRGNKLCAPPPQFIKTNPPIVYSGYDVETGNHNNDIALIPLKSPAVMTDFVRPICLRNATGTDNLFHIAGWGKTLHSEDSDVKRKVEVDRFDLDKCVQTYKARGVPLNKKNQLCAGGKKDKDSCTGDSGGPLMVDVNNVWYAEGIVSFGIGCGQEGLPGVYTNIPRYVDWIKKTINRKLTRSRKPGKVGQVH